jgi:apolipoprotein N-acyltransferase
MSRAAVGGCGAPACGLNKSMTAAPGDHPDHRPNPGCAGNLTLAAGLGWAVVALAGFHVAQTSGIGWLQIPCAFALIELSRARTHRKVFYPMLAVGFGFFAPQMTFLWTIFGPAAIALWIVLSAWIGAYGLLLRLVRLRFGNSAMLLLAPVLWTGLEYFRSELYYLRFGWLTFGMANHHGPALAGLLGSFLFGTVVMAVAAALNLVYSVRPRLALLLMTVATAALTLSMPLTRPAPAKSGKVLHVAGVQLEFCSEHDILSALNRTRARTPQAQLLMLSEYTFQSPPPDALRQWCASNRVYLAVGGTQPLEGNRFYNMAYVIGPGGSIVHQQVKSVPIQFFNDGDPAPARTLWDSPWGKLGVLTCYDLSYTRVVDDFVKQGAIALLNPTMDVADWGAQEHLLHSRVAPIRALEYGIPIFRVASSGVSQLVSASGQVIASAPYPGEAEIISGELPLDATPRLPLDRHLAPLCSGIAGIAFLSTLLPRKWTRKKAQDPSL